MANRKQELSNYLQNELRLAIDEGVRLAGAVERYPYSKEIADQFDDAAKRIGELNEEIAKVWELGDADKVRIQRRLDKSLQEIDDLIESRKVLRALSEENKYNWRHDR